MEQIKIILFLMLCMYFISLVWRMYADSYFINKKHEIEFLVNQREEKQKEIQKLWKENSQLQGICLAKDLKLKQAGEAVDQQVKDLKENYDKNISSQFQMLTDEIKQRDERIAELSQEKLLIENLFATAKIHNENLHKRLAQTQVTAFKNKQKGKAK